MNEVGRINLFLSSPCKEVTTPYARKLGELSRPFKVTYEDEEKENKIHHYLVGQKSVELKEVLKCMKDLSDKVAVLEGQMTSTTQQLNAANAQAEDIKFWAQTVFSSPLLTIHDACRVYLQALEKRAIELLKERDLWEDFTHSSEAKIKLCPAYRYLDDQEGRTGDVSAVKKRCLFNIHQELPQLPHAWMERYIGIYELSGESRNDQGHPIGQSLKDGVKITAILCKIREMMHADNLPGPFNDTRMKPLLEASLLYLSEAIKVTDEPAAAV